MLYKQNTGDVLVVNSISYVLLGIDTTNLYKRFENVLTHTEDEDLIDIKDKESLYNKTVYVLDLFLYPVKELNKFDSTKIININVETLKEKGFTFVNKHYDVNSNILRCESLESSRKKFDAYYDKMMVKLNNLTTKYINEHQFYEFKAGNTALVIDGYRFKFYVCIGHKNQGKSLYFAFLSSYPILFLERFPELIEDINNTNFCYVGPRITEKDIIRQRKCMIPLTFQLNPDITFNYPQQRELFKDFKEFGN